MGSKLTWENVDEIRAIYQKENPPPWTEVGRKYGVTGQQIRSVVEGKAWPETRRPVLYIPQGTTPNDALFEMKVAGAEYRRPIRVLDTPTNSNLPLAVAGVLLVALLALYLKLR